MDQPHIYCPECIKYDVICNCTSSDNDGRYKCTNQKCTDKNHIFRFCPTCLALNDKDVTKRSTSFLSEIPWKDPLHPIPSARLYECKSITDDYKYQQLPNNINDNDILSHIFCIHTIKDNNGKVQHEEYKRIDLVDTDNEKYLKCMCTDTDDGIILCPQCRSHIDKNTGKCEGCKKNYCVQCLENGTFSKIDNNELQCKISVETIVYTTYTEYTFILNYEGCKKCIEASSDGSGIRIPCPYPNCTGYLDVGLLQRKDCVVTHCTGKKHYFCKGCIVAMAKKDSNNKLNINITDITHANCGLNNWCCPGTCNSKINGNGWAEKYPNMKRFRITDKLYIIVVWLDMGI